MQKAITRRLRLFRAARHITQRDTAERARLPYTRYMDIENGYREPTPVELARIARALKTSADALGSPDSVIDRALDEQLQQG